jgi:hypothetical protein
MTRRTKSLILLCSLLAALFHFGTMGLYTWRLKSSNPPAGWLRSYGESFFHQDWKLFVPPPEANYRLFVQLTNGQYYDLLADIRQEHQKNRLAAKGHLLISFVNYIYMFEQNTKAEGGQIINDPYFNLLQNSVQQYSRAQQLPLKAPCVLVLLVEEKKTRIYFN